MDTHKKGGWWKASPLASYGLVGQTIERVFLLLEIVSPIRWFLGKRIDGAHVSNQDRSSSEESSRMDRARKVECFLIGHLIADVVVIAAVFRAFPDIEAWLACLIIGYAIWRIVDIIQATVNVSLFDHLRRPYEEDPLWPATRIVVLTVLNYLELIVLFGLLYSVVPWLEVKNGLLDVTDFFYFSVISQTSIGYGDIAPRSTAKLLAALQGVVGLFFTLLIIARMIATLPKPK